jgi:hypothetical protein
MLVCVNTTRSLIATTMHLGSGFANIFCFTFTNGICCRLKIPQCHTRRNSCVNKKIGAQSSNLVVLPLLIAILPKPKTTATNHITGWLLYQCWIRQPKFLAAKKFIAKKYFTLAMVMHGYMTTPQPSKAFQFCASSLQIEYSSATSQYIVVLC